MHRSIVAGLTCLALLTGSVKAFALAIALPPAPVSQRVATSDAVVVGKVTSVDEKTVMSDNQEYRVFTLKIEDSIAGIKGLTHVKIACVVQPMQKPVDPDQPPIRIRPFPRPGFESPMLKKDQEVLLFVNKHVKENFYVIPQQLNVVDKTTPQFKNDLAEAKRVGKILENPMAGLKSKEAAERFTTASLLVTRYRTQNVPNMKEEEVSAEESKLILEGLASGNWDAPRVGRFDPMNPQAMFYTLDPNKPGWIQPMDFKELNPSMKKWLTDNAGKYRVKRYVAK